MSTWALVPVKPPAAGKSRLAPVLSDAERAILARHLARDVLSALAASPGIGGIALLAPAGSADDLAATCGAIVLADDPSLDFNGNLARAAARLAGRGARTVVIVHADLPLLGSADVAALLAAHGKQAAGVTLVEAIRDGGTNALCLTPPGAIGCHFGPDSARRHLEAARSQGVPAAAIPVAGFARDVDTVDDVRWLCGTPSGGAARRWLAESGVCARLGQRDGT